MSLKLRLQYIVQYSPVPYIYRCDFLTAPTGLVSVGTVSLHLHNWYEADTECCPMAFSEADVLRSCPSVQEGNLF